MANVGQLGWGAVRNWGWCRIVLVAVLVGLPVVAYFGLIPLVDWAIHKKISKNVAPPLDEELPITVTSFRSSANMVSTIGGMGEGLSCSLPRLADYFFAEEASGIAVRQRFRQACVFHDLCYRHGLATYGYTQNDCDELLQEQALRICISVSRKPSLTDCQIDAKKVAAGVKFAGFKDYRNWDRSTFFEFDPNPYRSMRFFVTRAIDDPFKAKDPEQHRNDPDQLLMMFSYPARGRGARLHQLRRPKNAAKGNCVWRGRNERGRTGLDSPGSFLFSAAYCRRWRWPAKARVGRPPKARNFRILCCRHRPDEGSDRYATRDVRLLQDRKSETGAWAD